MEKARTHAMVIKCSLLAALLASGSAWAQSSSAADSKSDAKSPPAAAAGSSPASGTSGKGTPMRKADQKMLEELAQANMAEVKTGELALQKSQNPQVKEFAQKMIDDHGNAMKDIQKLAEAKGVTLPTEVDTKHKAMSTALEKLSAERFDKTYMSQGGVADHKKTHKLLQDIQTKAKDTDLKALAAKLQPTVDQHLKTAQSMKDSKADAKGGTSAGSSGSAGSSASGSDKK